jgi:anion-transporting  ArsA/GET3 family ATPase
MTDHAPFVSKLVRKLIDKQLLVVTGKGGVGKSTIAAALAAEAARDGRRVLLASHTRIEGPHPCFGTTLSYKPVRVAENLYLARIDPRDALKEYVHRTLPLGQFYDWLLDSKAVAHFTEATPGFDDLLCLGKVYDHVAGPDAFDLVVLDAPSTGHAALMLRVPAVTCAAVATGPIHHNALKIRLLLEGTRTEVVLVALPEEMALREAQELSDHITEELDISVGALVLNRIATPLFNDSEIDALGALPEGSPALQRIARAAAERHALAVLQTRYETTLGPAAPRLRVPHVIQQQFDGPALVDRIAGHLAGRNSSG